MKSISAIVVIIAFVLSFFYAKEEGRIKVIEIFIANQDVDRPGQITEKEFWSNPDELDKVTIEGPYILKEYLTELDNLVDTLYYTPEEIPSFDHRIGLLVTDKCRTDTLFTEFNLRYWKKKGSISKTNRVYYVKI